jgi:hypothetical protein
VSISTKLGVSTTSPLRPRLKITRKSWPELVTRDVKLDELSISVFAEEPVAAGGPLLELSYPILASFPVVHSEQQLAPLEFTISKQLLSRAEYIKLSTAGNPNHPSTRGLIRLAGSRRRPKRKQLPARASRPAGFWLRASANQASAIRRLRHLSFGHRGATLTRNDTPNACSQASSTTSGACWASSRASVQTSLTSTCSPRVTRSSHNS